MTNLPVAILHVFAMFAPLFSRPVYRNGLKLFVGHILCKGRRTIADILRSLNLTNIKNFSKFHWVLNGAKWNCLKGSKILFLNLLKFIPSNEEIVFNLDSTVERRKGPKIQGLGRHRDAARSSKSNKVLSIGINWLVSAISVQLPFTSVKWSLPFLSILMPPEKPLRSSKNNKDLSKKSKHKKMTKWASQIAFVVRRWAGKSRQITIIADSAFACFKMAYACIRNNIGLISRLRLDARLYGFVSENSKRKRVAGDVLPKLSVLAKKDILEWEVITVKWYGGITKKVFIQSGKCLWYYIGHPPVAIHWVLIKEQENSDAVALFSTNLNHSPVRIIEGYVERWSEEVTFEEARRHLGMETQRQWSDEAIAKATPIILASFSVITIMAWELSKYRKEMIPPQRTSWYRKENVTFSDVLAYIREGILREKYRSLVGIKRDQRRLDIENLIMQMAAA
jgi:DDE superfamily endonuclease